MAWIAYHLVTFYDKTHAVQAIFRKHPNGGLESNNRFIYPSIRLNRFWHTTRLLQLAPGTGIESFEGVLLMNVTIKIFSWAWTFGEHRYHAISYCWGDSTVSKAMYLDGKLLQITETLQSVLQSLRRQEIPVILWADQICIDQSHAAVNERNQQVQRMGEIYANADSVIIWLGKSTKLSDGIFDRVNTLDEPHLPNRPDHVEGQTAEAYLQQDIDNSFSTSPDANEDGLVKDLLKLGFDDLLQNAWFSRIWVLQEAALARDLFVQAGSRRVPWKRFMACVRSLHDTTGSQAENARRVYDIEMLRQQKLSEELEDGDLLMMVEAFRGRQATDFRDKIYGLFGLTNSVSPARAFQADHSKSPEQVFVDFALWHIQTHRNVRVLAKCCSEEVHGSPTIERRQSQLPSWATDWSVTSPSDCGDLVEDSFLPKTGTRLYNASRGLRADARIVFEHQIPTFSQTSRAVLVLNGIIVDTVAQVVDRMHTWRDESDFTSPTWVEWIRFALEDRSPDPYGSRRRHLDALRRTLIIDRVNTLERASSAIGEDFEILLEVNDAIMRSASLLLGARDVMPSLREERGDEGEQLREKFAEWLRKWNSVHLGKKIFRTARGYLGVSCEHVQNGDKVAILWGGRLPFILREDGDILLPGVRGRLSLTDDTVVPTYKLIGGECYVHGFADGEGLDIAERAGILPTKICLV